MIDQTGRPGSDWWRHSKVPCPECSGTINPGFSPQYVRNTHDGTLGMTWVRCVDCDGSGRVPEANVAGTEAWCASHRWAGDGS